MLSVWYMEGLSRIRQEEANLMHLLQKPAADNFTASCPNPGVLQRCEAAPRLDRYNLVVPSMRETDVFDAESLAEGRATQLSCKGAHKHGELYMPCSSHSEYEHAAKQ